METSLNQELDLPLTGILELSDRVGMPSFNVPFCEADHIGNQATNFGLFSDFSRRVLVKFARQIWIPSSFLLVNADGTPSIEAHFASALALRRLCASMNAQIYDCRSLTSGVVVVIDTHGN